MVRRPLWRFVNTMRMLRRSVLFGLLLIFLALVQIELGHSERHVETRRGRESADAPASADMSAVVTADLKSQEAIEQLQKRVNELEYMLKEEQRKREEFDQMNMKDITTRRLTSPAGDGTAPRTIGSSGLLHTQYPEVKFLNYNDRKRILITGGAGFVGSHLVDRLMLAGHEVIVADNFFTGRKRNVEHWINHENFELLNHDIVNPLMIEVDEIYHLASPASPPHYMYNPVKTIKTNTVGTVNMLGLAKRVNARILVASTSEVYGDPEVHPQSEEYWGHVNPIGPRACYDEGKRVAETLAISYEKQGGVDIRIARIFNTYGPRMHMNDGRVVSNFVIQSLKNEDITVYGDGMQTRSFQYVSDLVQGLMDLMASNYTRPVNLGNPVERTIMDFAKLIKKQVGSNSTIVNKPPVEDDPQQRRPVIKLAKTVLKWEPNVDLRDGLQKTIDYFDSELSRTKHSERNIIHPDEYWLTGKSSGSETKAAGDGSAASAKLRSADATAEQSADARVPRSADATAEQSAAKAKRRTAEEITP